MSLTDRKKFTCSESLKGEQSIDSNPVAHKLKLAVVL